MSPEPPTAPGADIVVVMGVSGVGKSTIAKGISTLMGWTFAEGDAFHPQANIDKMSNGIPLTDEDRWPWLALIADWMREEVQAGNNAVVTCSALRRRYRDVLRDADPAVRFLHLAASEDLVGDRLSHRQGHYMPTSLLHSQYDTLEPLDDDELAAGSVVCSVEGSAAQVLARAMDALRLTPPADDEEGHRA
ncbi:Carbohydrate kinase, thermoresistant gluconokinase [Nostocoides japonicum T1-X7]|uniref:Gluconokinase n=1 Tax=Nostocoides japonicum T1-X7 TaxID=1194083 RepID=A0A077LTE2_9MICO|nr:gluconokinase [Tetrasphaera japonica]CCH76733.1 Carbohydrate kinase, thermoresistant gluconokinase [Tetrasphaera japonica T1-X7]